MFICICSCICILYASPNASVGVGAGAGVESARELLPVSGEKNTPFAQALALQSGSRNCSPAHDLVFFKLDIQSVVFSGGVFFSQTPVASCTAPAEASYCVHVCVYIYIYIYIYIHTYMHTQYILYILYVSYMCILRTLCVYCIFCLCHLCHML